MKVSVRMVDTMEIMTILQKAKTIKLFVSTSKASRFKLYGEKKMGEISIEMHEIWTSFLRIVSSTIVVSRANLGCFDLLKC